MKWKLEDQKPSSHQSWGQMSLLFHLQFKGPKFLKLLSYLESYCVIRQPPRNATEIPAMRAFDSDLHDKPKFARLHWRRHSKSGVQEKAKVEEQEMNVAWNGI